MHKIRKGTTPAVFPPKFQKPAHQYPTNFSKLNYIKSMSQLSRSKCRISVRGPALFKIKLKSKLLSYENEVIFF